MITACAHRETSKSIGYDDMEYTCVTCGQVRKHINGNDLVTKLGKIGGVFVSPPIDCRLVIGFQEKLDYEAAMAPPAPPKPAVVQKKEESVVIQANKATTTPVAELPEKLPGQGAYARLTPDEFRKLAPLYRGKYVEQHRIAITLDLKEHGLPWTCKSWGMSLGTFYGKTGAFARWDIDPRTLPKQPKGTQLASKSGKGDPKLPPAVDKPKTWRKADATDGADPLKPLLPAFPEFNDNWISSVQIAWLDTYAKMRIAGIAPR